jgi:hypothetical protein
VREVLKQQVELGEYAIGEIRLDLKSRDDVPKLLLGLQYIYTTPALRQEVFDLLQEVRPAKANGEMVSARHGRPGMDQWKILVLGVVRLGLDADYDRLQELANQHRTLRQMLGHADWHDNKLYDLQTLKDNLRLFTPELLDRINQAVVRAGHVLVKKSPDEALKGRCDSFVVETDVHFPTDINLLHDAVRKTIECCRALSDEYALPGWRQSDYHLRQFKKSYRIVQKLKHSTSKDEEVKAAKLAAAQKAHEAYLVLAQDHVARAQQTRAQVLVAPSNIFGAVAVTELDGYLAHVVRQVHQIERRVLKGEVIPHNEKVFSIFEPHTEWISKGKAGVPVELGVRVAILEDQHRFILHHRVMTNETDDLVARPMVEAAQKRFPTLRVVSFDKGFHSQPNQQALKPLLDLVALPKKGRRSAADQMRENDPEFVAARRRHSAVESAINGLEQFGLDRCPDHGLIGFQRYVALAVLARNLHRLGAILRTQRPRTQAKAPEPVPLAA